MMEWSSDHMWPRPARCFSRRSAFTASRQCKCRAIGGRYSDTHSCKHWPYCAGDSLSDLEATLNKDLKGLSESLKLGKVWKLEAYGETNFNQFLQVSLTCFGSCAGQRPPHRVCCVWWGLRKPWSFQQNHWPYHVVLYIYIIPLYIPLYTYIILHNPTCRLYHVLYCVCSSSIIIIMVSAHLCGFSTWSVVPIPFSGVTGEFDRRRVNQCCFSTH